MSASSSQEPTTTSKDALRSLRHARHAFERSLPPRTQTLASLIAAYDRGQAKGLLERVGEERLREVLEKLVGEDDYVRGVVLGELEGAGRAKAKKGTAGVRKEQGKGRAGVPPMERKMSKD